jgi:hypothetical protein
LSLGKFTLEIQERIENDLSGVYSYLTKFNEAALLHPQMEELASEAG